VTSRDYRPGDFATMIDLVSELWPDGRHGIGYAFMAQRLAFDDWDLRLWFDRERLAGWGWRTAWRAEVGLNYEARDLAVLEEIVEWAQPALTTVKSGDDDARDLLRHRGFEHDPTHPWIRWNQRALAHVDEPVVPSGYRLATMAEHGDLSSRAGAHRSAFAPSRFSDEVYEAVRREAPWRAELDCVVVDPDGEVAAFALGWLDEANRVGELEPVGVRAEQQRRGLGRAVSLHALRQLQAAGAETALVGSRGDDEHPVPRALYESIGFRELWRDLVFRRAAG
jgi:ribosomal protein S18 acetylase RimI-like enzyme